MRAWRTEICPMIYKYEKNKNKIFRSCICLYVDNNPIFIVLVFQNYLPGDVILISHLKRIFYIYICNTM